MRENYRRLLITAKRQGHELTELRREDAWFAWIYRKCEDAVAHRLDLAYRAFFARGGYPRFKNASRWEQIEFPRGDRALKWLSQAQDRPAKLRVRDVTDAKASSK